ncbi:hypothetical protein E2P81_ATG01330 [Venturia nashicola]|uniref:Uncharacterized protein n=1 Tax=Venturia nashicola TaxID=86259 RepID=A0A4Z1PU99_9PEZI|nr:hypothetical protein E6O75_ATG01360 [Venturia nashicola]TLD38787.1 hypothetical protein E2P81_ATG01330 [Venturia nashicola]
MWAKVMGTAATAWWSVALRPGSEVSLSLWLINGVKRGAHLTPEGKVDGGLQQQLTQAISGPSASDMDEPLGDGRLARPRPMKLATFESRASQNGYTML